MSRTGQRAFFGGPSSGSYARVVGLPPDDVVRDFLARHPDLYDAGATDSTVLPVGGDSESGHRPPTRLRYLVGRAIGSLSYHIKHQQPDASPIGLPATTAADVGTAGPPLQPVASVSHAEPDLAEAAHLCTELGRARDFGDAAPLLPRAAAMLDVRRWSHRLGVGRSGRRPETDPGPRIFGRHARAVAQRGTRRRQRHRGRVSPDPAVCRQGRRDNQRRRRRSSDGGGRVRRRVGLRDATWGRAA